MAELGDLSLRLRMFLRAYRFRRIDEPGWSPPRRPIAESRVALVTSAGLVAPDQERFDDRKLGGDPSYRILPAGIDVDSLIDCHRSESFDHHGIAADANVAFPLDRLRELAAAGDLGEVAPRHLSLMGSLTLTGALRERTAPEAAGLLVDDRVDIALLVPV